MAPTEGEFLIIIYANNLKKITSQDKLIFQVKVIELLKKKP